MRIMGHRGARDEAPENTLGSIELALAAGVDGVEFDVHRARDGHLVVIHDETVDRTTDGAGRVADLTLAELRRLDAGRGERIPTLDEVLDLLRGRAAPFVEIKAPGCEEEVVRALTGAGLLGEAWVIAFDHRQVRRVKGLAPEVRTGCLIYGRPVDPAGLVRAADADLLSLGIGLLDADLVAQCHAAQIPVCAWNCNDPAAVGRYRAMQLDWLATDAPTHVVPAARA